MVYANLHVALELGRSVVQREPVFIDGLEDHLGREHGRIELSV